MEIKTRIAYFGPNRRSDGTLVEILLGYTDEDLAAITAGRAKAAHFLEQAFAEAKIPLPEGGFDASEGDPVSLFGDWCNRIGLALQTATGHEVSGQRLIPEPERLRVTLLFEHEESQVGERAGQLALHLLGLAFPALPWDRPALRDGGDFTQVFEVFSKISRTLVQPRDTAAIVRAARRAGVPVVKLERDPYEPVQGDFRIRMNSMLMLGHAANRQVTDGTLALERARFDTALVFERALALRALTSAGLPIPQYRLYTQPLISPRRARRLRQELGGEVVVKPARRTAGNGIGIDLPEDRDIARAVDRAVEFGREVLFEERVPGDTFRLIYANHALVAVLGSDKRPLEDGAVHTTTVEGLAALTLELQVGLAMFTVVTPDAAAPLNASGGKVVDLEVAPELDRHLDHAPEVLDAAADGFIAWLFPPGAPRCIPIAAVTGTNGKTTTTRMINHLLKHAGRAPGMVCTDGVFIGQEVIEQQDLSNLAGHFRVFESKQVDTAVFECNHKGLAAFGLSFDRCDVAAVTNVTEDHLGDWGVETVEDMAVVKRSLAERSRTVVLNADDPHCLAMIPHLSPERLVLSALDSSPQELFSEWPQATACVAVEEIEAADWITWHTEGERHLVIPVTTIPATFDGAARFNVRNAMQAIAAGHALGLAFDEMAAAMAMFRPSPDMTPGRLNVYEGLPFRLIVDFAHNPDGLKQLTDFSDTLEAEGRKVVTVASSGDRRQQHHAEVVARLAGHFDYYICREYLQLRGREPGEMPDILEGLLIEQGVQPGQIGRAPGGPDSLQHVLALCQPGDLVFFLGGNKEFELVEGQIAAYLERHPPEGGSA